MLLGEGTRKVGEPCWSHAQCARSQSNAHCLGLVCTCVSGLHSHDGKCSRNIWEDSGFTQWELILMALVLTLFMFAVFVGCLYFIISRCLRSSKTSPSDILTATKSFKANITIKKKTTVTGIIKTMKVYESQLVNDNTVESQLIDEDSSAVMFSHDSISTASTQILEPVRFITPLDYRSSDSETWQSSRRSSASQGGDIMQIRNPHQHLFTRAWSAATTYDDSDDWFQPNRNHIRTFASNSPASTTRLPLLLRASTFSESDESP